MEAREHPMPGNALGFADILVESESEKHTNCLPADSLDTANVVTSIDNRAFSHERWHRPVLDIDMPAKLISSSTSGHHHLYIDRAMAWVQYQTLLKALAEVGIIDNGYAQASINRGFTAVRLPWIKKESVAVATAAKLARPF